MQAVDHRNQVVGIALLVLTLVLTVVGFGLFIMQEEDMAEPFVDAQKQMNPVTDFISFTIEGNLDGILSTLSSDSPMRTVYESDGGEYLIDDIRSNRMPATGFDQLGGLTTRSPNSNYYKRLFPLFRKPPYTVITVLCDFIILGRLALVTKTILATLLNTIRTP